VVIVLNDIKIVEKTDDISFEDIHKILHEAHKENNDKNINMKTANLTGEELKERIGKNGKCFIALDENKLIGTLSIRLVERNCWYAKGTIPDYMLAAVLPEYQGKHVNSMLSKKVFDYCRKGNFELIELDTAEKNINAIKIYKHLGFCFVDFKSFRGTDHYSVVMVKWLKKCPYNKIYIYMRYILKKLYIKSRYKKNGEKKIWNIKIESNDANEKKFKNKKYIL